MTLQNKVEYCSKNLGIKKRHIARGAGINENTFSAWFRGRLILNSYQVKKIEEFVSKIEKAEPYLKVI